MKVFIYLILLIASLSEAKLGDTHLRPKLSKKENQNSSVYVTSTYKLEDATITEYINSSNQVFAISWTGRFHPDERNILGANYLNQYKRRENRAKIKGQRNSLNLKENNLIVKKSGHMGHLNGKAYDPNLVPAGVNADALP